MVASCYQLDHTHKNDFCFRRDYLDDSAKRVTETHPLSVGSELHATQLSNAIRGSELVDLTKFLFHDRDLPPAASFIVSRMHAACVERPSS